MKKLKLDYEELEWLYAPNEIYYDYNGLERPLGVIFPYRREWEKNEKYPLLVFLPGAAWHHQEIYNDIPKFSKLAEKGVVFAIVKVRESDIATFPAQMYDIHRAVTYLIDHAEQFHIDIDRIFLGGNSSGGHLALISTFTKAKGLFWPEDAKPYEIKGVIGQSASSEIDICVKEPLPPFMEKRPTACLLGVETEEEVEELAATASCRTYVSKEVKIPPVQLFHHDADPVVGVLNSRTLTKKLEECGKQVEYYEIEGEGHCGAAMWTDEVVRLMEEFIKRN